MSHWYVLFVRGGYEHEINEFFNLEGLASFIPMKKSPFVFIMILNLPKNSISSYSILRLS